MAKASRAEWVKRVECWQDSGLTAKEFAAELAVSPNSLTFWKWKLRREGRTEGDTSSKMLKPVVKAAEPKFLQLVPTPGAVVAAAVPLELVIRGDIVVRVPPGFDDSGPVDEIRIGSANRTQRVGQTDRKQVGQTDHVGACSCGEENVSRPDVCRPLPR